MPTIIELPAVGWHEVLLDPIVPRDIDQMEGRRTEGQKFGTAWWAGVFMTTALTPAEFGRLEAFMMQAGDNGEVFRAYDASRPRPLAHDTPDHQPLSGMRAGGGSFDGTATIVARTATTLSITGLPANFQFLVGDYVEVRKSPTVISLHRIVTDVQANGSGAATLSIRHALDLQAFTLPLTANFEKPACLMQIDPGSYKPSKPLVERRATFAATEVFFS
jgi:hypothetical protein